MIHRIPSLKQLLSGVVLTAAGTGFLLSGCAHGPSRSFQAIWEPDGAIRRTAARIASFGRNDGSSRTALAAAEGGENSETGSRQNVRAVAFNPLQDPFLNDPLRASSTGYPAGAVPQVAAADKPRNPFEAISTADTTAAEPAVAQARNSAPTSGENRVQHPEDPRFAGGFDSQLERLRHSLRKDLNTTSPRAEVDNSRIARMRVDAMMQQAQQQVSSGQLEAALATVEHANQLAEKDAVFFGPNETRPTDMLRDVREKLEAGTQVAVTGANGDTARASRPELDVASAGDANVIPLLPRQQEWTGEELPAESAVEVTSQDREQKPAQEPVREQTEGPELSFRPASEFIDQPDSSTVEPVKDVRTSDEELPPASAGPAFGPVNSSAVDDSVAGPDGSDSRTETTDQTANQAATGLSPAETREPLKSSGSAVTSRSPQRNMTTPDVRPARLLAATTSAGPAAAAPVVENTQAPALETEIAAVTETVKQADPAWSVWEGNRSRKPAARAVPAMPPHLGWKPAVEPPASGVRSALGSGVSERTAGTSPEARKSGRQPQPLSAEMAASQPLTRITAPSQLSGDSETLPAARESRGGDSLAAATEVAGTDHTANDQSAGALPAGPLPEIFNVKTISQEEAQADARNRKKAGLPSGLVIGILLSLVAVAICWHRLSSWFRGRRRTMA